MDKPYHFASDCPNCGEKDSLGAYKGARTGDTKWGHQHMCCSNKCGIEFATSPKRIALENTRDLIQIEMLKARIQARAALAKARAE